jgi:hypothetical protein
VGDYVQVGGLGEMITQAADVQSTADQLGGRLSQAYAEIDAQNADPATFPPDDFTNAFLPNYRSRSGSAQKYSRQAVQNMAANGQIATGAMVDYLTTEQGNTAQINATRTP